MFEDYAVLGDDIVIWDKRVAIQYRQLMLALGVEIGLAKSIISDSGTALEFAKRTLYKGQDVSPIPLLEYSAALESTPAFMEFINKYQTPDAFIKQCLGIGYRSSLHCKRWILFQLLRNVPTSAKAFHEMFVSMILSANPFDIPLGMSWRQKLSLMSEAREKLVMLVAILKSRVTELAFRTKEV